MKSRAEVRAAIRCILIPYSDCIAWEDFGDAGNPCYDPYTFSSPSEANEAAITIAAVMLEIPKYSQIHNDLAHRVANELENKWVTYDWLIKAVARILTGATFDQLLSMAMLSRKVKDGMKAKGITQVKSIEEALN